MDFLTSLMTIMLLVFGSFSTFFSLFFFQLAASMALITCGFAGSLASNADGNALIADWLRSE